MVEELVGLKLGSNRTFMELKFRFALPGGTQSKVLIAPLWNWNMRKLFFLYEVFSSNRTFMELKYCT